MILQFVRSVDTGGKSYGLAFCSWKPLLETCGSDLLRSVYLKACIPDLKTNPKSGFGVLGFVCSDLR
ncbi:hypothetical protein HanPI659440_Chr06g0248071 [Helianthus annuus]|nr:hypothetical protein HanPI659440_Chr06g0248071 [Helianthus annuus]